MNDDGSILPIPCRETDPEIFFTDINGATIYTINTAKQVCGTCWFITQCLELALSLGDVYGIWGGKTRNERKQIADSRGITLEKYYSSERGDSLA